MSAIRQELVRGLGLTGGVAVNVANIIGTGVFLKTRVMTCNVGAPLGVLAVWLAAGLFALAGALCYAEVAALLPESGGGYVFLRRAYGRFASFCFGWMEFGVVRAGGQAALAVGFAIFLNVALGGRLDGTLLQLGPAGRGPEVGLITLVALAAIWIVALLNCASVAFGGRASTVLATLKVAMVAGIGVAAFGYGHGDWSHLAQSAAGGSCEGVRMSARGGVTGFGAAMLGALWAYDGWNNVTPLAGEVRDPGRNLPRIFLGSTLLVIALYLFVNSAYFYLLAPVAVAGVAATSSLATEVLRSFVGPAAVTLMAAGLVLSSFGALHASVFAGARVPFAMARDGLFFRALAVVAPRSLVPVRGVLAQAGWASVLALSGSFDTLTDASIFAGLAFHALIAGSLFVFRRTLAGAPRSYHAWGYPLVPALFIAACVALTVNTFIATPRQALLGVAMLLAGLPCYAYWVRAGAAAPASAA
jgi:basic amino acid/polyamine antiporter, APA family